MLLPEYSMRTMVLLVSALAIPMTTLMLALQGIGWAIVVSAMFGFIALLLIVHGGFFGLIYAIGSLSPFRESATPPLVPGAEQESTAARRPVNEFSVGE